MKTKSFFTTVLMLLVTVSRVSAEDPIQLKTRAERFFRVVGTREDVVGNFDDLLVELFRLLGQLLRGGVVLGRQKSSQQ